MIDGMDWATVSMNHRMGFHEIAKYYIDPGIHSLGVNYLTVNKKEWDKLPKAIQEILYRLDYRHHLSRSMPVAAVDDGRQLMIGFAYNYFLDSNVKEQI